MEGRRSCVWMAWQARRSCCACSEFHLGRERICNFDIKLDITMCGPLDVVGQQMLVVLHFRSRSIAHGPRVPPPRRTARIRCRLYVQCFAISKVDHPSDSSEKPYAGPDVVWRGWNSTFSIETQPAAVSGEFSCISNRSGLTKLPLLVRSSASVY